VSVRIERESEQKVGESVRPLEEFGPLGLDAMERPEFALRASGDRSRDVEMSGGPASSRERERSQGRNSLGDPVDLLLDPTYVSSFDPMLGLGGRAPRRRRELAHEDEQLVLKAKKERGRLGVVEGRLGEAEKGRELVERSERADPGRILGYAGTPNETGLSAVAATGIEPRGVLASGRPRSSSSGDARPCTGQYEMCSTSLCFAS
jgi:hypothetical protein